MRVYLITYQNNESYESYAWENVGIYKNKNTALRINKLLNHNLKKLVKLKRKEYDTDKLKNSEYFLNILKYFGTAEIYDFCDLEASFDVEPMELL